MRSWPRSVWPRRWGWWQQALPFIPGEPNDTESFANSIESGDFDGDGFADLSVGATGEMHGDVEGAVFLLFGSATGFTKSVEVPAPETDEGRLFGYEQTVGDFNKDGFADIYIDHATEAALGYVIYGDATLSEPNDAVLQPIADDGSEGASESRERVTSTAMGTTTSSCLGPWAPGPRCCCSSAVPVACPSNGLSGWRVAEEAPRWATWTTTDLTTWRSATSASRSMVRSRPVR
ncbi:hypothetical protein JOD67_004175 [Tenggerimyces flavus]|nr:FG-GAP-like repeat-containing protein [Tenggerimyces flavus]MBM7787495.1 hypothetical protein [Tenggerimyces flavus]